MNIVPFQEYIEGRRGRKYFKCVSCEDLRKDANAINTSISQKPSKRPAGAENKVEALVMSGEILFSISTLFPCF
jgi:hypothetical protein